MEVRYSKHLEVRLKMRGLSYDLPRIVFERAEKRFRDSLSGLDAAVLRTKYFGKRRDIMVAYRAYRNYILLITIHPLKPGQLENRVRSGRWKEI